MTVYLWMPHANGLEGVLAADRISISRVTHRHSKSRRMIKNSSDKLTIVNDNIAYVCAGPVVYKELFGGLVDENKHDPLKFFLTYEREVKQLFNRNGLKENFSYFIVFAGIPGETKLRSYNTLFKPQQGIRTYEADHLLTGGSGKVVALEYAQKHWKKTMEIEKSIAAAYATIDETGKKVQSCSSSADVAVVRMSGIQLMED